MPKHNDLRVWWIPQVPMEPFFVPVNSLVEARLILDTLAEYDLFQYKNNIKPDYANAGGLMQFDSADDTDGPDGSWVEWCDEESANEIDSYTLEELRSIPKSKAESFHSLFTADQTLSAPYRDNK